MRIMRWVVTLCSLPAVAIYAQIGPLATNEAAVSQVTSGSSSSVRNAGSQKISLNVEKMTLEKALMLVAEKAKLKLSFSRSEVDLSELVTAKFSNVPVNEVLERLTKGSSVAVRIASDGETILVSRRIDSKLVDSVAIAAGKISGRVIDSSTKEGIRGAVISVSGAKRTTITNASGDFILPMIPVGNHVVSVKIFGYKSVNRSVTVTDNVEAKLSVALVAVAASLNEVVTTATGMQRKMEIGNDVTTLKVDSILRAAPVDNLSDLLATRVPGVYAMPSSGNPGAPTKIRIRGVSSVNQSNDPIIIVDGVRVANDQTKGERNMALSAGATSNNVQYMVSSPLDLIDINNIETLEVFKGPSAVALYGSDAANGVIVITTKRGKEGPLRYSANARFGVESMPGKWPVNYYMFGHSNLDPTLARSCTLMSQVQGDCTPDSLVMYQILNDERRTPLGRGLSQAYSLGLSGGGGGLTYSLTGSIIKTDGMLKLPEVDRIILSNSGRSIPSWVRNPESDIKRGLGLNIGIEAGKSSNISWSSQLMHTGNRASPLRRALSYANSAPPEMDPSLSGLLSGIPHFRTKIQNQFLKSSNSLDLQSNPVSHLTLQLQAGGDWTMRNDKVSLGATECFVVTSTCTNDGLFNTGENIGTVLTSNARASLPLRSGRFLSVRNSLGLNWVRNQDRTLLVNASGLPVGATSGSEAAEYTHNQSQNDRITAGVYLESVIGIADRWYLPLAIRTDAGSALGSSVAPKFPKLGLSYVVSDDDWFMSVPGSHFLSMLRVRGAFGVAGVQPNESKNLRTYESGTELINNLPLQYLTLKTMGNTQLRPERSREFELGFDADVLDQRITTGVTFYRKFTNDLIVDQGLPPSAGATQQINLGDVKNTGIEIAANIISLDGSIARLSHDLSFSRNKNILVKLADANSLSHRGRGYPLNGYWSQKILGVYDINEDGYISSTEYVLSDSTYFLGAPYPSFLLSGSHSITLFQQFTVSTLMQYEHNLTQRRTESSNTLRANYDPNSPLIVQAAHLYSEMNQIQTVSLFRLQELSLSYSVSQSHIRSILGGRSMRVSLQGRNIGLWTNYRGKDPKVNGGGIVGASNDNGVVPQPRRWQLTFSIL